MADIPFRRFSAKRELEDLTKLFESIPSVKLFSRKSKGKLALMVHDKLNMRRAAEVEEKY